MSRQLTIKRSTYASMFKSLILDSTSSELPLILCIKHLFQIRLRKYEIEFKFKDTVGFVFLGVFFLCFRYSFFSYWRSHIHIYKCRNKMIKKKANNFFYVNGEHTDVNGYWFKFVQMLNANIRHDCKLFGIKYWLFILNSMYSFTRLFIIKKIVWFNS